MIERLNSDSIYFDELEKMFPDVFTKSKVLDDIENNSFTNYFTYIVDNNPAAFINYYTMYERCELININVDIKYQNIGIASNLLNFMFNDCKNKYITSITLEVNIKNAKALHLYQKYGFKQIGIRKGYYHGTDGILMEKELM